MKIAVMSDLHLEFDAGAANRVPNGEPPSHTLEFYQNPPRPDADVLVLAGDIYSSSLGVDWARDHFSIPTIMICGNHEAYGHELFRVIAVNRQHASTSHGRIVFLERASWECEFIVGERVRFIGTTLWTDFNLYRTPAASMAAAQENIVDFDKISVERGYKLRPLCPLDTVRVHETSIGFLRKELARPFDGKTVVVTHHAPSPRSVAPKFKDDPLNPAFASNLEELIETYHPPLWIHGHMHDSFDYTIGRTRVVCNPRGYFPDQLNPNFNPELVLQL